MRCYVFLSDESFLTWRHYNTFNRSGLTDLTCSKAPGFWMVEHQLVADDIILHHQIVFHDDCCLYLQENFDVFLCWCLKRQMWLQPSKCEAFVFLISVLLLLLWWPATSMEYCDEIFGMNINQHLTWSDHCKVVCSRGTKLLNLLRHMLFCCS